MNSEKVTIGATAKKKFFTAFLGGFFLFSMLIATMGFTGTIFAVPLGGMGDFYVAFDKLEGEGFELNPQIGETGDADEAPLVRNKIDSATIENLHIYKDLKMPTGNWVRVNIRASEPTQIEGLIQDAQFIDANLMFDEMAILETNTSGMSAEEAFENNWSHNAEKVKITDATIVTDYLFQNMVALNGATISLESISGPEHTEGVSGNKDSDSGMVAGSDSGNDSSGFLPETASNLYLPIIIGAGLLLIGGVIFLVRKRKRLTLHENEEV